MTYVIIQEFLGISKARVIFLLFEIKSIIYLINKRVQ